VRVDERDQTPGYKFNDLELKGVPIRVELGPKDIEKSACVVARRDIPGKEGKTMGVPLTGAAQFIADLLPKIQANLFERAKTFRDANIRSVDTYEQFREQIEQPGFIWAHWDGTRETERKIQDETKATIRCIPFDRVVEPGKCMVTGAASEGRVLFARAY